jgi:hypothetical protein
MDEIAGYEEQEPHEEGLEVSLPEHEGEFYAK